jgi:hypothetical protein
MVFTVQGASSKNQTVAETELWLWVFVELASTFIVSCMPAIPPLYTRLVKGRKSSTKTSSKFSEYSMDASRVNRSRGVNTSRKGVGTLSGIGAMGVHQQLRSSDDTLHPFGSGPTQEAGDSGFALPMEGHERTVTKIEAGGPNSPGPMSMDPARSVQVTKQWEVR